MKKIVVLYHSNCPDGFGAAYAAWEKFGGRADYIGVDPRTLPLQPLNGRDLYILDSSYPARVLKRLRRKNRKVVVIDHHISNREDIREASESVFNIKHSAAVLSWHYFQPRRRLPLLFRYLEDFDLWRFRLPFTREIAALITVFGFDFKEWRKLIKELEDAKRRRALVKKGGLLLAYEKRILDRIIKNAEVVKFMNYKALAVNSPILESELGHALYKVMPPLSIVWREKNGKITVSLRSNGQVDVSKIAAKFGGGGHKAAAGFALQKGAKFPWKLLKPKWTP